MEEKTSAVEFYRVGESSCWRFTWTINNFSMFSVKKLYSDIFYAGGYKWRILIFPKGNSVDYLSMYLDVADSGTLPKGWSRAAQFSLSVINQVDGKYSVKKEAQHMFNARESDWGFTSFLPLGELHSPGRGFILNDTCIVEAEVRLHGLDNEELKRKYEAEARLDTVSFESHLEQPKPPDCQDGIPDAQETELPPMSVKVPPEQSIPSAKIGDQLEQGLDASPNSFSSTENPSTRLIGPQSEEVGTLETEDTQGKANQSSAEAAKEPTFQEAEKSNHSFAELDMLFSDIQNLLGGKATSFQPPQFTNEEVADAKETFRECLSMKLANVIEMGKAPTFKNSLSILLTINAFPPGTVHEMTKFLANFDRSRESYLSAQRDLREAKEKQNSVSELKTILKELSLEFVPIRNRAKEVDQEIAKLERELAERKEEKAQLRNSLEDLAGRASTSRQTLINAEQEMKLFMHKKEQAEEMVGDMERLWESLQKDYHF